MVLATGLQRRKAQCPSSPGSFLASSPASSRARFPAGPDRAWSWTSCSASSARSFGAVVGGFVFSLFGADGVSGFNIYSMIVAIVGAVIVLWLYRTVVSRRAL
jgi:hypothetical protein